MDAPFFIANGRLVTTSLLVANALALAHVEVIQAIESLAVSGDFFHQHYWAHIYCSRTRRCRLTYEMSEAGFAALCRFLGSSDRYLAYRATETMLN